MVPITDFVNTTTCYDLKSDLFEGKIVCNIKSLIDEHGNIKESEYFKRSDRQGVTWSIQVQGRFLVPYAADDILFGNTFDRPLKLPWGTSAVLKFMNFIDPTLEHDLMSQTKPWALSPLISTMPHFVHSRVPGYALPPPSTSSTSLVGRSSNAEGRKVLDLHMPEFPPETSLKDSTGQLYLTVEEVPLSAGSSSSSSSSGSSSQHSSPASSAESLSSNKSGGSNRIKLAMKKSARRRKSPSGVGKETQQLENASQRRSYFADEKNRKAVVFGPEDVISTDFCYGFINFSPSLSLQLPGGLSFDLMKYWDGQPVRFVCCERKAPGSTGGDPWGRIFWCVAIEMVDDA